MRISTLLLLSLLACGCSSPPASEPQPKKEAATPAKAKATDAEEEAKALAAWEAEQAADPADTNLNLSVENCDLATAAEAIAQQADRTILVDPAVSELITVSLVNVSWREAVDTLAALAKCEVVEREGGVLLRPAH